MERIEDKEGLVMPIGMEAVQKGDEPIPYPFGEKIMTRSEVYKEFERILRPPTSNILDILRRCKPGSRTRKIIWRKIST